MKNKIKPVHPSTRLRVNVNCVIDIISSPYHELADYNTAFTGTFN